MRSQHKEMGAVRIKIKLTNAVDEILVRRGLLEPNLLRTCETEALVDTGAVYLVVPPQIVKQLGLEIMSQQIAKYADGREEPVGVTEAIKIELQERQTTEDALVTGDEVLIGQVILEKLDLLVSL